MRQLDSRAGVHRTLATGKDVEMERYYFFYLSYIFYYWLRCGDEKMRHFGSRVRMWCSCISSRLTIGTSS